MKKRIVGIALSALMLAGTAGTLVSASASGTPSYITDDYITHVQNDAWLNGVDESKLYYNVEESFCYGVSTFETWLKIPEPVAAEEEGGYGIIFGSSNGYGIASTAGWDFSVEAGGKFRAYQNAEKFGKTFEGVDLRTGEWTHVAFTYDAELGVAKYYVNGELKEEVTENCYLNNFECAYRYNVFSNDALLAEDNRFKGEIKQVTVYAKPVDAGTVALDMADQEIAATERPSLDLLANWSFDGVKAWTVSDTSGNANDLRLYSHDLRYSSPFDNGYDYSFVLIPDTQGLVLWQEERFYKTVDWIAKNKETLNIKFVMHMGDITDGRTKGGDATMAGLKKQWAKAAGYMSMLDGVVPYSVVLGNHDYDAPYSWVDSRDTNVFNEYFPYSKYSQTKTFGGAYEEGKMDNVYHKLEFDGIKYLILAVEYSPRSGVLQWADKVVEKHPNHRVIITTHAFLQKNGLYETESPSSMHGLEAYCGADVWDLLAKKHSNVMAVFSGHFGQNNTTMKVDKGDNENKVLSLLVDFQSLYQGAYEQAFKYDEAVLEIIQVDEESKTMRLSTYMPEYEKFFNLQGSAVYDFSDSNNPALKKQTKKKGCGSLFGGGATVALAALVVGFGVRLYVKKNEN